MRLIFAGSSKFAVPVLQMLVNQQKHFLVAVITQPDSKKGRGLKASISPVKQEALKHSLEIWQPESINNPSFIKQLENSKVDLIIVVAYGQKISDDVLRIPPKGCINVHPSLLPKYRGAAPINYAILNGDKQTGITVFKITKKMDAGDVFKQVVVAIKDNETFIELNDRLAAESASILPGLLDDIEKCMITLIQQDETKVTYAPKFKKTDGEIDWNKSSQQIVNQIKAMYPWPGTYTFFQSPEKSFIKVDILEAQIDASCKQICVATKQVLPLGSITEINNNGIVISCGQRETLALKKLKPAGSKELTAKEFENGYHIKIGDRFGK
jgi:methionyl-tRNA formyltransferase